MQREARGLVVEGVDHELQVIALAHACNVMQLLPRMNNGFTSGPIAVALSGGVD